MVGPEHSTGKRNGRNKEKLSGRKGFGKGTYPWGGKGSGRHLGGVDSDAGELDMTSSVCVR